MIFLLAKIANKKEQEEAKENLIFLLFSFEISTPSRRTNEMLAFISNIFNYIFSLFRIQFSRVILTTVRAAGDREHTLHVPSKPRTLYRKNHSGITLTTLPFGVA